MSINVSFSTNDFSRCTTVALPLENFRDLCDQVEQKLNVSLLSGEHVLNDTIKDITTDEDVKSLKDGDHLIVALCRDGTLVAPARERISFQPHPKTLTMAGDYEYFAAQVSKTACKIGIFNV